MGRGLIVVVEGGVFEVVGAAPTGVGVVVLVVASGVTGTTGAEPEAPTLTTLVRLILVVPTSN